RECGVEHGFGHHALYITFRLCTVKGYTIAVVERRFAIPGALGVALAFHAWPTGHWLQRTFLSMIVHELGHAITAWWCGFAALPTVWKTLIPDERGVIVPLALAAGGLRWGLLAIGAAAYVDTFATWWAARSDLGAIPLGEIEGVGLSDPSKLIEDYGWKTHQMVSRYVTLGVTCLIVLTAVYAWQ